MQRQIKFIHNWNNKLNNPVFTTIRSYSARKYLHYSNHVGEVFDVVLAGERVSQARLVDADVCDFKGISVALLALDTGIVNQGDICKLFGKLRATDRVIILLFETVRGE